MSEAATYLVILITTPSHAVAEQLAEALVAHRVAACGNIIPSIQSVFRWKGGVQRE